ncbi:hypothetical protein KR059_005306 [Drosophila kikkawai]|nr:hypothetical protein KR059_005306 [Drosophila kikkawai]
MSSENYTNQKLERAQAAIARGSISVGVTGCNAVVIAADRTPPSPLCDVHSVRHVEKIDKHIGMVYSGLDPDYRILVKAGRKFGQVYYLTHQVLIPVKELVERVGSVVEVHTNLIAVRPFGVTLLVCGWSNGSPQLYKIEPSGLFSPWKASAQGKNACRSKEVLVERYCEGLDTDDAIHLALLALWKGCEMIPDNIEIGICDQNGFRRLDHGSVQEYLYSFVS